MRSRSSAGRVALLLLACGVAVRPARAGDGVPASDPPRPGLIETLAPLSERLRELAAGTRDRVTIVHLGDSHVQGEMLTGILRRALQARYGAAGRGLVMPFEVAGTNGPSDLVSVSDAEWNLSRLPAPEPGIPTGAAGLTISTADGGFILKIGTRMPDPASAFDRITIFTESGPGWTTISAATHPHPLILESSRPVSRDIRHTVRRGDTLYALGRRFGCTVEQIRKWNRLPSNLIRAGKPLIVRRVTGRRAPVDRSGFIPVARFETTDGPGPGSATIDLPVPVSQIFLRGSGTWTGSARLYGIVLDRRGSRGIAYHSIGVNGAEFRDYNAAGLLWRQVARLAPDLLIVTLGTNDAFETGFSTEVFDATVRSFLDRAGASLGRVPVLFMGPPDACDARGRALTAAAEVRDVLDRAARTHDAVGYWDAAGAMGGEGSIRGWRTRRLACPDLVHLTADGYRQLADRLLEDLFGHPDDRARAQDMPHAPD